MNEIELLQPPEIIECRYCLSGDNISDIVSPCQCKGSFKYVHKSCLRNWFVSQSSRVVIPGYYSQFSNVHKCEVCNTEYTITKEEKDVIGESIVTKLILYYTLSLLHLAYFVPTLALVI